MTRFLAVLACLAVLVACASSPAPDDTAAREATDKNKPGAVFSHIEIGGGY